MKLEQSFEVQAPLERVWQALIDVERVAPCLPGAEVTGRNDDGSYDGSFKVKIGPTAAAYVGKLQMEEIDESAHRARMDAHGTDRRGQGGAKATIVSSVEPAGTGTTRVTVDTDYHITGRLARFGRGGMIEEISNRLLGEFARNLQDMLAHDHATAEAAPAATGTAATGAGPQAASTTAEGESAIADTLEAPAVETGEATAETLTEAAKRVAAAGDASATQTSDAAASGPGDAMPTGASPAGAAVAAGQAPPPPPADEPAPLGAETETEPRPAPAPGTQSTWTPPAGQSDGVDGLALVGSVMLARIKRNPAPAIAMVLGFLLALRVFRRGRS